MALPPFYVGYLPLPQRLRGFLIGLGVAVLVLDGAAALALVAAQPPHPSGAWGEAGEVAFRGVFSARPTPLLRVPGSPTQAVILVGEGKHGAPAGLDALDGHWVEARGYPLRRGDLTVLQLDAVPALAEGGGSVEPLADAGSQTLLGEIVDTKCWAGAMNPGEGKAHRSCAGFCLMGEIPPMLVTRAADGTENWVLLAASDGAALGEIAPPLAGEKRALTGTLRAAGDLKILAIAPDSLGGG